MRLFEDSRFDVTVFPNVFKELLLKEITTIGNSFKLNGDSFAATLLVSIAVDTHLRILLGWGDGWFLTKRKSGLIEVDGITFDSNAPYYPFYDLLPEANEGYDLSYGLSLFRKCHYKLKDNSIIESVEIESKNYSQCSFFKYYFEFDQVEDPITQIVTTSDGLCSYKYDTKEDKRDINMMTLIPDFIVYPNPVGNFIQRRMGNRIKRVHKEEGIIHWDDISFAGINLT